MEMLQIFQLYMKTCIKTESQIVSTLSEDIVYVSIYVSAYLKVLGSPLILHYLKILESFTLQSFSADIKSEVLDFYSQSSYPSCHMNGDGLTLVEMLNKEPSLVHLNGGQFIIPSAISDSQPHFQRQNCAKLSVKKIHRPASVPSTKKFEDCGVSIMNNRDKILIR